MLIATRGGSDREVSCHHGPSFLRKNRGFWACEEMPDAYGVFVTGLTCIAKELMIPFNLPDTTTEKGGRRIRDEMIRGYRWWLLTKSEKDRFVAISAIAGQMAHLLDDWPVAGLFLEKSSPCLIYGPLDSQAVYELNDAYSALSRSGANLNGQILPRSTEYNLEVLGTPSVSSACLELVDKEERFGQQNSASLQSRLVRSHRPSSPTCQKMKIKSILKEML